MIKLSHYQIHVNGSLPVSPLDRFPPAHRTRSTGIGAGIATNLFKETLDSLNSCAVSRDLAEGCRLHGLVIKSGFSADVIVGNSLMNMYSKCESVESARHLFEEMPDRTVVSWTILMSGYCAHQESDSAVLLFRRMLDEVQVNEFAVSVLLKACEQCANADALKLVEATHCYAVKYGFLSDTFLLNSLVDSYAKSGKLSAAEKILRGSNHRDVVSWTSLISGAVLNGYASEALDYFFAMQEDGKQANEVTVISILRACSVIGESDFFKWIHGVIMKSGWWLNDSVANSLLEMYLVNGCFLEGLEIFCKFLITSVDQYGKAKAETFALVLQGCLMLGYFELGKHIHGYLIKNRIIPQLVIENSLIDMYSKSDCMDSAFLLFSRMATKDIVSWNTIITGLARTGHYQEALIHFREIFRERSDCNGDSGPDFVTVLGVLQACCDLGSYHSGQIIHGFITKTGLISDKFVQNSLIDMYGKTGRLDLAESVFEDMIGKDLSSWNSMVGAFGVNGKGQSAIKLFRELTECGTEQPNGITFLNILSACVHTGMVEEGLEVFKSMVSRYRIRPRNEHFACVVDMLGRSGRLDEAEDFIRNMPIKPGREVWGALMSSCSAFCRVEIAERAASELSVLDPNNNAWRVTMSNIYASVGRWEDVAKVRLEMKKMKGKEAGWSSVEVHGEAIAFVVNDTSHPEGASIYEALKSITSHIGYTSAV